MTKPNRSHRRSHVCKLGPGILRPWARRRGLEVDGSLGIQVDLNHNKQKCKKCFPTNVPWLFGSAKASGKLSPLPLTKEWYHEGFLTLGFTWMGLVTSERVDWVGYNLRHLGYSLWTKTQGTVSGTASTGSQRNATNANVVKLTEIHLGTPCWTCVWRLMPTNRS